MSLFETNERLLDLMAQRSTNGLSEIEQQEFDLLASSPEHHEEAERFDLAAAALSLSLQNGDVDEMPRDLHDRLLISAGDFFGHATDPPSSAVTSSLGNEPTGRRPVGSRTAFSWREAISLAVTAACLALLLSGLNPFARAPGNTDQPIAQLLSPAEKLEAFETANPPDLVKVSWTPVNDKDLEGNVVWSDRRQEGYMVLENLDINDPTEEQYQLWIFDTDKEQAYPVDGGVFDISSSDRVVIPIDARIPVDKAVRFAVTKEKRGGVVVSDRKQLPGLADVE